MKKNCSRALPRMDHRPLNRFETFIGDKYLGWDPEKMLLSCKRCIICLGKTFVRHLRAEHNESVSRDEEDLVTQICYSTKSIYRIKTDQLLTPISWLPIYDGYRCLCCPSYAISFKHIRFHCKLNHGDPNLMMKSKIQTLSKINICYFGVEDVSDLQQQDVAQEVESRQAHSLNFDGETENVLERKNLKLLKHAKRKGKLTVEILKAFEVLMRNGYSFH